MRILAVDDEPEVIEVVRLCFNLRWPDAEVIAAATGQEALAAIEGQAPDLVLLDIMLPGMDGFDICYQLRQEPGTVDLPILMLSAKAREADRETGLKVGADAYITKPVDPDDIIKKVEELLIKRESKKVTGEK